MAFTDQVLRIFTDVRSGEGRTVLKLGCAVFLLLCSYYLIKPLREGWLSVSVVGGLSKMEIKAYAGFGQTLLLAVLMTGYGRWVRSWSRAQLLGRTAVICAFTMAVFWSLQPDVFVRNLPGMGILFYLWVGMFGVFLVAQFWAFAADLYHDEQGRRLLPAVAVGATAGAVVGSWLAERLVASRFVPPEHLLLVAIVPLVAAQALTIHVALRGPRPAPSPQKAAVAVQPRDDTSHPVSLVTGNRLLLGMAVVTVLLSWVNTNGENILFRVVQEHVERGLAPGLDAADALTAVREGTTRFYAGFFFWVNLVALLLQTIVASRLLRFGGFGPLFLISPLLALVSYSAMALIPVLAVIQIAKTLENASDYSLSNTARHVFWLPMPREVTYQAKPTIDSLFARLGDGLAAVTVLIGVHLLALSTLGFIAANLVLVAVWVVVGVAVIRAHRKIAPAAKAGRWSELLMGPRS